MAALYELDRELAEAYELMAGAAEANEGEIPKDFLKVIEAIEGDRDAKLVGYGKVLRSIEGLRDVIADEAARLALRKRVIEANIDRLKEAVKASLELAGETKKQAGQFKFSIVQNSQPSLRVLDRDSIPVRFFKPAPLPEVDAIAVKAAIKDGKTIDGVELVQGFHLRVS